jgi:hypothetical protein
MGQMLSFGVSSSALVVLAGGALYLHQSRSVITNFQRFNGCPSHMRQFTESSTLFGISTPKA